MGPAPSRPHPAGSPGRDNPVLSSARIEAAVLREATADAHWDTVERDGGLDAVVDKIDQADEEKAVSAGAGRVDDFRPRGSKAVASYQRATEKGLVAHIGGA